MTTSDVLIVGAGSAGCVVAEHLSRDPSRTVMVVESGPGTVFESRLDRLPIDHAVRAVPIVERRGRPMVRGRGLGGSSAVNGGYFLRGHRTDYTDWPWTFQEIEAAFAETERLMRVRRFSDEDLGDVARATEAWAGGDRGGEWPRVGVNRVRTNSVDGMRWTTGNLLAADRPNLLIRADTPVSRLLVRAGRAVGVVSAEGETISAGEIVVCGGTIGTSSLMTPIVGPMPLHEHAERIVRFTPRRALTSTALLQTVIHTSEGLEIRPYSDDFAAFTSLDPTGAPIGVADMIGTEGSVAGGVVDLGEPDVASVERLAAGVEKVVQMLGSVEFADLVEPGSVRVDPTVGTSQHAWGTLPSGSAVDADGRVEGIRGLRVIDGSILPGPLSSGPHATIVMLAALIATRWV
ncbi:MAG: mycofactocin system GMC family oxidoreductase MftG [Gordonia sp. (in: high G+C Gram-positive bacteria)]|jgi:GMC family mycofactocin-associated oxidreductase|nr:mycofactocin system GMC family oxidoreductase MftG [Gordonia sp. (in: high G+C Gram-positive bacteria)]